MCDQKCAPLILPAQTRNCCTHFRAHLFGHIFGHIFGHTILETFESCCLLPACLLLPTACLPAARLPTHAQPARRPGPTAATFPTASHHPSAGPTRPTSSATSAPPMYAQKNRALHRPPPWTSARPPPCIGSLPAAPKSEQKACRETWAIAPASVLAPSQKPKPCQDPPFSVRASLPEKSFFNLLYRVLGHLRCR